MTTTIPTTTAATPTTTTTGDTRPDRPGDGALAPLGGAALLVAPVLMLGGIATSPPQADDSAEAYITSLAADPAMTALSAGLFHYGWLCIAFGALAALTLVRGRRGRAVTTVGALMTAVGSFQIGGLLLSDWYLSALGNELPLADAARVFAVAGSDAWVATWLQSGTILPLLGLPVLFAGLARAGVLPWWVVPLSIGAMVVPFVVPGPLGLVLGAVCWAPMALTGYRLVRRARADVRQAEALT